ncbi:chemotaxis protein CheX [Rhodoferax saidenbachensis]|uniref:Chemotaxis protein CheX n=1 Tax=Rhodoferax saidenbachensis TaxID=1484693 RepID=A0A1P8K903_9BURK|nr:chemotaxis protein CheX [Rhodoferax saidenbachensis]APW42481.1 chemotaxis protein CheX [Rhodoferax saidenbachensis]
MEEKAALVSKVLVLDDNKQCLVKIKNFCEANSLVGVKAQPHTVQSVLNSNIDLGCVFLAEDFDGSPGAGLELGRMVHAMRPDLPIFLRRESNNLSGLEDKDQKVFFRAFSIDEMDALACAIQDCIFSLSYPSKLIRGIAEMSKIAIDSQFKGLVSEIETPYTVRDRLIFGEIYTLIPIEGSWCRGYMMLQVAEEPLMKLVRSNRTPVAPQDIGDFRNLNSLLGEITNLIWGSFKNRYIATDTNSNYVGQVPIVINHSHRYISFGSENPQLCFKYTLVDQENAGLQHLTIYQRFVFNLNWSPEDYSENEVSVHEFIDSGELELF